MWSFFCITVMGTVDKLNKFASAFLKSAFILAPGQSTTNVNEAIRIGKIAIAALDQIDEELLAHYAHANFREAMSQLANGTVPDYNLLKAAVDEFNAGLKNFSNMINIPVQKVLFIL